MAASGAKDISVELLLGRPIYPLFRSLPEFSGIDTRTDEEKLLEVAEVAAIFKEEYAAGNKNPVKLPELPPENTLMMGDERELFEEAGILPPRRKTKQEQELEELHEEFKDFM